MSYSITSIDGGGIRGCIPVRIMRRIADKIGEAFLRNANLLAGTSTGGLIAIALAAGLSIDKIEKIYVDRGREIFRDKWYDQVKDVGNFFGAQYSLNPLSKVLREYFGERTLGDLNQHVLLASFDLSSDLSHNVWKEKLFHNQPGQGTDRDMLAWKAGLATSAAPTFFPSFEGYVDGGVFANNPALCALGQALDKRYNAVGLSDVRLLSFGTGRVIRRVPGNKHDYGLLKWASLFPSIALDTAGMSVHYLCDKIIHAGGGKYHRIQPNLPVAWKMDDAKAVPAMLAVADKVDIGKAVEWLS